MKVGYVFECGPDGGDMKVLRHLTSMILPDVEFDYEALSVKTSLLRECGKASKRLLDSGCEKVFIVWDLFPAWREDKSKPCRREDKEAIIASLAAYELLPQHVIFLCIEEELEAWLIADGRILNNYFSKPHRLVDTIKNENKPDKVRDPKGKLIGYFKTHRGGQKYDSNTHAEHIIKRIKDFQKLKKSETFKRFYYKLRNEEL